MTPAPTARLRALAPAATAPLERYGFECGDGWEALLADVLPVLEREGFVCSQVKEKFGGLRVYGGPKTEATALAIRNAESRAWVTCEDCGAAGKHGATARGWARVRCGRCAA